MKPETVQLGHHGPHVSRVAMGGCPLGGHGWGRVDDTESIAAVRCALEQGINFFDTADVYGFGHSEQILSRALGEHRHDVVVASKFGVRWGDGAHTWKDISPKYLRKALEASLRRLRLDSIPLYYVHWPDDVVPVADTVAELQRCREEGKIRYIGLSNFTADQVRQALSVTAIEALQVRFSLVDREGVAELLALALESNILLVTWGSLAQGLLTGKYNAGCRFCEDDRRSRYANFSGERLRRNLVAVKSLRHVAQPLEKTPAQVALRWLLDTPGVGAALFGAKRPAQVEENAKAAGWRLREADYRLLETTVRARETETSSEGPNRPRETT